MITRRESALVLLTALATGGIAAWAQSDTKPIMPSVAIEWNSIEAKPNANGSGKKFIEGATATLEYLESHATTLRPGASNHEILPRADEEVMIVKEGTVEAYVKDKWVRLGPGSLIFYAANAMQSVRNTSDSPATYHVVTFRPYANGKPATKPAI